jgi:short-subunit dehydrogenase
MVGFAERYGPWGIVVGASAGLGKAFARSLARRGVHVALVARRGERLEALAVELRREFGVNVQTTVLDVGSAEAKDALAALASSLDVGVAVYNAAFAPLGEFVERPLDDWLRVVDVNVRGPLCLARACAPSMVARGRGAVVLMSSLAGEQGTPRLATYAASKAFNTVLAEGLWHELRPHGVDVVASCAGAIRTPGYVKTRGAEAPGTLDPEEVSEQTLLSLGGGPRVVPGLTNRLANEVMRRLLPRRLAIHIMAQSTETLS